MKSTSMLFVATALMFATSCKKDNPAPTPTGSATVTLGCDDFKTSRTLTHDASRTVDYYIDCVMDATADIVIEPGVIIEFGADAGINVDGGSLSAVGSATERIVFTGKTKQKGFWKGILFNSNNVKNQLGYCDISNAGGASFNSNNDKAAVIVWGNTKLNVTNCTITNSANVGISAVYTSSVLSLENTNISTCGSYPVMILPSYMGDMSKTCSFTGNSKDNVLVQLNTDEINKSMQWQKLNVPYRISSNFQHFKNIVIEKGDVVVEPGVVLELEQGNGITINQNGAFKAQGTSAEKVVITGVDKAASSWRGIYFRFTTSTNNVISNAVIEYAGNGKEGGKGAISMWANPTVSISSVDFKNIGACAIYNYNSSDNPNLTKGTNTLTGVSGGETCHD